MAMSEPTTDEQAAALPAGAEMDAAVIRALGQKWAVEIADEWECFRPPFSTDPAAALRVAEAMELCLLPYRNEHGQLQWCAGVGSVIYGDSFGRQSAHIEWKSEPQSAPTLPLAICLAALAAVRAEREERRGE